MAATKKILVSLHGKRIGLSQDNKLVVEGRTVPTADDAGTTPCIQGAPGTLNATGTLTAALIATKIVTTTAAAEVVATLDTGTAMDTALAATVAIGEALDFEVVNTAAVENLIVTAASGHTIVGNPTVAPRTAAKFRSRRTAASTWVTYALSAGQAPIVVQVGTLNATGTLTAALIDNGIVTSTTAAAVVATVDTGTAMDTALAHRVAIGESIAWSAIATGANSFTVTAAAGHTLVGSGVVATGTSGRFLSSRSAANTWVSYRLA